MRTDLAKIICDNAPTTIHQRARVSKAIDGSKVQDLMDFARREVAKGNPDLIESQKDILHQLWVRSVVKKHIGRHEMLGYISDGMLNFECSYDKSRIGEKSVMMPVTIPTYRYFRNKGTGNILKPKKVKVREDLKLLLEYGIDPEGFAHGDFLSENLGQTTPEGLTTTVDFLIEHNDKTYFGLAVSDLRKYDGDKYRLLDKVGDDLFSNQYGGFVIFSPMDDPKINLELRVPVNVPDHGVIMSRLHKQGAQNANGDVDMDVFEQELRRLQDVGVMRYAPRPRDRKARKILTEFPDTGNVIGLPYDISDFPNYFIDTVDVFGIR